MQYQCNSHLNLIGGRKGLGTSNIIVTGACFGRRNGKASIGNNRIVGVIYVKFCSKSCNAGLTAI